MLNKPRIAIIDADSFVFAQASLSEKRLAGNTPEEDIWLQVKTEDEAYAALIDSLEAVIADAGCQDAIICLTHRTPCFRYDVLPTYKGNRKATRTPILREPLAKRLSEQTTWSVLRVEGLEADDVCGISAGSLQGAGMREPVVISIDKDLLQIPGWNYNPGVRGKGGRLVEVSGKDGDRYHLYQTLVGDDTDGYVGCPGVGTVKANKLLDACAHLSPGEQWRWVVEAFRKRGLDEEAALVQARVARILRVEDWDPIKKEHRLWTPPLLNSDVTNPCEQEKTA